MMYHGGRIPLKVSRHCLVLSPTCYDNLIRAGQPVRSLAFPGSALQPGLPPSARVPQDGSLLLQDLQPLPLLREAAPDEGEGGAGGPGDPALDLSQFLGADHHHLGLVGEAGGGERDCNKTDLFCCRSSDLIGQQGQLTSGPVRKTTGLHQLINIRTREREREREGDSDSETTGLVNPVIQ